MGVVGRKENGGAGTDLTPPGIDKRQFYFSSASSFICFFSAAALSTPFAL